MREYAGEPRGPDQPRAQVLVAVGARAPLRARIVEVHHRSRSRPTVTSNADTHLVDAGRLVHG